CLYTDTAPTEIYTLSLHDALPISCSARAVELSVPRSERLDPRRSVPGSENLAAYGPEQRSRRICACRALVWLMEDDDEHHFRLRSEEHTSELQSRENLVCRLLLEK